MSMAPLSMMSACLAAWPASEVFGFFARMGSFSVAPPISSHRGLVIGFEGRSLLFRIPTIRLIPFLEWGIDGRLLFRVGMPHLSTAVLVVLLEGAPLVGNEGTGGFLLRWFNLR